VRERFKAAANAICSDDIKIHVLPTASLLEPIMVEAEAGQEESLSRLNHFVAGLNQHTFSKVVNLSFSPFSSYLVDALAGPECEISGYTRHADGFLSIPDDSSAYFYAQAGIGKHNRYHVTQIFAAVAGVDLVQQDFSAKATFTRGSSVLVHLGTSQADKTYPAELWREVLSELVNFQRPVILIGSSNERAMAEQVAGDLNVINRVGESAMEDLVQWVAEAALVIGADSAPIHIASLTNTPVLNLSCATVNFWETGPLSAGSRILFAHEMHEIKPKAIASEALALLAGTEGQAFATCEATFSGYSLNQTNENFFWNLLQALYTQADYPQLPSEASPLGFHRLFDIAELALAQMSRPELDAQAYAILSSVDDMLNQLPQMNPWVGPVVAWFQTERLRIGPASAQVVLDRTRNLFEQLALVASVYHRPTSVTDLCARVVHLARLCAPALREFKGSEAGAIFQEMLSMLQELSRHTTKVAGSDWSSVLKRLTQSLENGDLLELADTLEGDLPEWIKSIQSERETSPRDVIL
jgi:hypothetical protein